MEGRGYEGVSDFLSLFFSPRRSVFPSGILYAMIYCHLLPSGHVQSSFRHKRMVMALWWVDTRVKCNLSFFHATLVFPVSRPCFPPFVGRFFPGTVPQLGSTANNFPPARPPCDWFLRTQSARSGYVPSPGKQFSCEDRSGSTPFTKKEAGKDCVRVVDTDSIVSSYPVTFPSCGGHHSCFEGKKFSSRPFPSPAVP